MENKEILENLQYTNAEQRDIVKQFFTNPKDLDTSKKTIVFSTPSETGTSYFRLFEPMRVMWKHYKEEANFIYTENLQPNHLKLADCIIMHRAGNLHSHFLQVAKYWPKTEKLPLIIHNVDDNEFNLPKSHPMHDLWYQQGKDKMSIQSIKESHMIVTTTEKLARTFKNFNKNVQIVRNMFDWELPQWNLNKNQVRKEMLGDWCSTDDKIIIGWAGLTSHFEDIKRMHKILKVIHDKYPNAHFVLAGMALKDTIIETTVDEKTGEKQYKEVKIDNKDHTYRGRVENLYGDFDKNRIKIFDALPLEEYAKFYYLFDISLAYIENNAFNSCKSEIKVVESIRCGCIPVFSNFGGYKDFYDRLPKNLKYKNMAITGYSHKPWVKALEHHMQNFESSKKQAQTLKVFSDQAYDLNENVWDHLELLLQATEEHEENEINKIAKYSNTNTNRLKL